MGVIFKLVFLLLLVQLLTMSLIVQIPADFTLESLGGSGQRKALILHHPSRDSHFSDEITLAAAGGLEAAGFTVERATMTNATPARFRSYDFIAVVSNTYYWTPDLPSLWYLERANLNGLPAIGLICGAGATSRSERLLDQAIRSTGANLIATQPFWLARPNDRNRLNEPNRDLAIQAARQFAFESATNASSNRQTTEDSNAPNQR
jgi:hypothetical protein